MNWPNRMNTQQLAFCPRMSSLRYTMHFRYAMHCCGVLALLICVDLLGAPKLAANEVRIPSIVAQTQVSRLGSHFSGNKKSHSIAPYVWITVIPILAALGASALYQYHQNASLHLDSPQKLFRELGKAHQLTWDQRRMLYEAANVCELETPATLFVRPDLFDKAQQEMASVKGEKVVQRMSLIRDRLFGSASNDSTAD